MFAPALKDWDSVYREAQQLAPQHAEFYQHLHDWHRQKRILGYYEGIAAAMDEEPGIILWVDINRSQRYLTRIERDTTKQVNHILAEQWWADKMMRFRRCLSSVLGDGLPDDSTDQPRNSSSSKGHPLVDVSTSVDRGDSSSSMGHAHTSTNGMRSVASSPSSMHPSPPQSPCLRHPCDDQHSELLHDMSSSGNGFDNVHMQRAVRRVGYRVS